MAPHESFIPTINNGHIDVQELGKANSTSIPQRFIRDHIPTPTTFLSFSNDIPVVDLSTLCKGSGGEFNYEISKLVSSCQEWGFFQVVNHGIDLNMIESMENVTMEFFNLPLEEKQKYSMAPGGIQGYGQAFVFSDDQKLDWCNMFALAVIPDFMRQADLWPTRPAKFSETLEEYSKQVRILCQKLLSFIAISLGLNANTFEEMFGESVQATRMNYYPPCPKPELVMGLSPHSDGSALTVLQQRKGSPVGLQILKDGDTWVPVQPIPEALVINIGDTIEVLTNGKYKSVEHRAVADKEMDRLSIVTFYAPSYDIELGPMKEFINENNPCKYKRYNHGEYSHHYVTNKLQGKKTLEFAKI
ncbi:protein SRG1-like [Impatiens glandulifera]|uniref:protein SRG1-like n=1 Tax=Impatiens glandulifera TaxID=253017 RepID=UPI001FB11616|nr:protein SRG1-like [Impatiens glandulifera]